MNPKLTFPIKRHLIVIENWIIFRIPGFLAIVWFGSSPTSLPVSKLDRRHTVLPEKRENLLTGEGWMRSQIIRPRESLVLYISRYYLVRLIDRVSDPHWFNADPDTDPDPGFDDLKLEKITDEKFFFFFFWSKTTIYLSLGLHKGRPSYRREAFSPQKRTSSTSKHENSVLFSIFVGNFCPPGSGSAIWMRIRIRIQQLKLMRIHADPDPKPCSHRNEICRTFDIFCPCIRVPDPNLQWFGSPGFAYGRHQNWQKE